jgi:hypothetical protein
MIGELAGDDPRAGCGCAPWLGEGWEVEGAH